jgi:Holliday junction DNA helicase RuvB
MSVSTAKEILGGDFQISMREFVGQEQVKAELLTAAKSAKKRRVRAPHTMLATRPGFGKTTLALAMAQTMGTKAQIISGKITAYEFMMALADMRDRDVLVIDEAHQMGKGAEFLLHYMENGTIVTPMGPEKQAEVTVVACTTESGALPPALLSRFECMPEFVPYTEAEGAKIVALHARKLLVPEGLPAPSKDNCVAIARAASGNPRLIKNVLKSVRDIAIAEDGANFDGKRYDLTKALLWKGLTDDGLTFTAQRYLLAMLKTFGGRPVGMAAMQDMLHEPGGLQSTEILLLEKGYIGKGGQGRFLTPNGRNRARELDAVAA